MDIYRHLSAVQTRACVNSHIINEPEQQGNKKVLLSSTTPLLPNLLKRKTVSIQSVCYLSNASTKQNETGKITLFQELNSN